MDIVQDISTLTTVQKSSIDRLCTQAVKCVCYCICEALSKNEKDLCLDIGIGSLFINIGEDSVKYRFEPSMFMDNSIIDSVLSGKNPVIEDLESSLLNKVNTTYKDLF